MRKRLAVTQRIGVASRVLVNYGGVFLLKEITKITKMGVYQFIFLLCSSKSWVFTSKHKTWSQSIVMCYLPKVKGLNEIESVKSANNSLEKQKLRWLEYPFRMDHEEESPGRQDHFKGIILKGRSHTSWNNGVCEVLRERSIA